MLSASPPSVSVEVVEDAAAAAQSAPKRRRLSQGEGREQQAGCAAAQPHVVDAEEQDLQQLVQKEECNKNDGCHELTAAARRFGHEALRLEWWERDPECREAKAAHTARIDALFDGDRERVVFLTSLKDKDVCLEENMFPYRTPPSVKHFTLWSRREMDHDEVISWVDAWLAKNMPGVKRWQFDDNIGNKSILIYHVHVYIETEPFAFEPRAGHEYFPPHLSPDVGDSSQSQARSSSHSH